MIRWLAIPLIVIVALLHQPQDAASARDVASPKQILDAMAKTYANCKSYQDTGVVRTTFIQADGNRTDEKPFKTAFVRPDHFRFEYTSTETGEETRYIVWCKGADVRTWWTIQGSEHPVSLGMAVAGATGVSSSSAHTVPRLLLPDAIEGFAISDLANAERLDDADLGGVPCDRLKGSWGKTQISLWLDQKTHLLLRMDQAHQFDDFKTETTTTYQPVIDADVPDALLAFDSPGEHDGK